MATKNMDTKTEQELLEDLRSKDEDVRREAANHPNATPEVLLIAIKDESKNVREAAKEAIEKNPLLSLKVAALQAKASS